MVKAAAGGGGQGMRVIDGRNGFVEAYRQARSTAQLLFGDGRVYVEKYLGRARHVEIQVLCDGDGRAIHLGERDCSVQRRHQKLVEETPAPGLSTELTEQMGRSAVRAALATGYVGAGTFEFLVGPDGGYYFMEVNCRIQVEHPVTEMVTGIDLVQEQIKIAAGYPLGLTQRDIQPRGVAIECRVNAENPLDDFAPTPGRVTGFTPPGGPFVRVDTHMEAGQEVSSSYDSLLAKVVAWAPSRDQAIARMLRALGEFRISGDRIHTTTDFLRQVIDHPKFRAARHSTAMVDELRAPQRV